MQTNDAPHIPTSPESANHVPRRERERLVRRKEIIDAAREVFARKGFADTTLDDVAERAEFGKGTLYNYFENKDALFASVIQDSFDRVMSTAREALLGDPDFSAKIERFVRGQLEFLFSQPETMYLMMREAHRVKGNNPMMQLLPQLLRLLGDTIAAEQKGGRVIDNATPVELATILVNMIFGQFSARFYGGLCRTTDEVATDLETAFAAAFRHLPPDETDKQIAAATSLIHRVYFNGITR